MKVFWMFSGGASSLRAALDDPNNGTLYVNVGAYHDKQNTKGVQLCKAHDVPEFFMSRREFYEQHGLNPADEESQTRFHDALTKEIDKRFSPDLICLSGYMRIVKRPLLGYRTILNVHPADLTILERWDVSRLDTSDMPSEYANELVSQRGYYRKLTGDNAVFDAIKKGERTTRSTVHVLTEVVDGGPILVQSKPFDVGDVAMKRAADGDTDWVKTYAAELQELMKTEGDGPAYLAALQLITEERFALDGDTVFLDGHELPYCGWRLV